MLNSVIFYCIVDEGFFILRSDNKLELEFGLVMVLLSSLWNSQSVSEEPMMPAATIDI